MRQTTNIRVIKTALGLCQSLYAIKEKVNMKLIRISIVVIIFVSGIISCEVAEEFNPQSYSFHTIETGELKMFTNYGQIYDTNEISLYLSRHKNIFLSNKIFGEYNLAIIDNYLLKSFDTWNFKIEILNQNKCLLIEQDTIYCNIKNNNEFLYFESDTNSVSQLSNIIDDLYLLKPLQLDSIGNFLYKFKPCIYVVKTDNLLKIPIVRYFLKNEITKFGSGFNYYYISYRNNIISQGIEDRLKNSETVDTLIIQESWIEYKFN